VRIDAPMHHMGGSGANRQTFRVTVDHEFDHLSLALMMACTNDGLTGVDSVLLPSGSDPISHMGEGYDAGTEMNDEMFGSVPDLCQQMGPVHRPDDGNDHPRTMGVISHHPGIQGGGDLVPELHGWQGAVMQMTVRRIQ